MPLWLLFQFFLGPFGMLCLLAQISVDIQFVEFFPLDPFSDFVWEQPRFGASIEFCGQSRLIGLHSSLRDGTLLVETFKISLFLFGLAWDFCVERLGWWELTLRGDAPTSFDSHNVPYTNPKPWYYPFTDFSDPQDDKPRSGFLNFGRHEQKLSRPARVFHPFDDNAISIWDDMKDYVMDKRSPIAKCRDLRTMEDRILLPNVHGRPMPARDQYYARLTEIQHTFLDIHYDNVYRNSNRFWFYGDINPVFSHIQADLDSHPDRHWKYPEGTKTWSGRFFHFNMAIKPIVDAKTGLPIWPCGHQHRHYDDDPIPYLKQRDFMTTMINAHVNGFFSLYGPYHAYGYEPFKPADLDKWDFVKWPTALGKDTRPVSTLFGLFANGTDAYPNPDPRYQPLGRRF